MHKNFWLIVLGVLLLGGAQVTRPQTPSATGSAAASAAAQIAPRSATLGMPRATPSVRCSA
ncbi:hypothetical protein [Deinococcus hopiensis]|uniref:Uncharacterized protein n=1 Tax=Deinococcus hopiensis KR-140 TaxID=695939 RepID=A0A1W1V6U7_9DEIO|nr:hypothetical protein [Deinococcus hopiensis]SMB89053.1 hypothetical protein SAMN00790413_00251 [Deinococcus hopiensis KR-140]